MKKIKISSIIYLLLSIYLGLVLFWGGLKKFDKPIPAPTELVTSAKEGKFDQIDESTLKIKNFVFGLKQTNYFWQFLGVAEMLAGLLLVSQLFSIIGAIIAVPITLQIFLFHLFLEPDDTPDLLHTLFLLLINIGLLFAVFPKIKPILFKKNL